MFSHPFRSFAGMLDYMGRTKYPLDLDVVVTCCENVLNVLNRRHEGSHPSSTRSIFVSDVRFGIHGIFHFAKLS